MKSAWDRVRLRVTGWVGPAPEGGDELRTGTGRRYQIITVNGRTLECLVLPADAEVQGRVFHWKWGSRKS
ncbi:hypothetical protein Bphyt_7278 (plasmid) [Paraburkholderia phytofirmans PsJN]|uniref:Uncharacterized protein n=1 Tax=Paraburkholderia phytofirmans (strain DSM 17436 / LMG 22146 / PsJN) TaxID=398527 RepID=B2TH14_PARPJ|nr:hypothetical protein Bphyt_7278 [Paraburkholderia phytofirmans PsJN]